MIISGHFTNIKEVLNIFVCFKSNLSVGEYDKKKYQPSIEIPDYLQELIKLEIGITAIKLPFYCELWLGCKMVEEIE